MTNKFICVIILYKITAKVDLISSAMAKKYLIKWEMRLVCGV